MPAQNPNVQTDLKKASRDWSGLQLNREDFPEQRKEGINLAGKAVLAHIIVNLLSHAARMLKLSSCRR